MVNNIRHNREDSNKDSRTKSIYKDIINCTFVNNKVSTSLENRGSSFLLLPSGKILELCLNLIKCGEFYP